MRVFISSTFRDMHAERDHLVKVSFPRVRQWCEERRLHLVDIDLRWGISREEAENGRALEICLEEIEGSRPFFICLLGEQYGSVAPPGSGALAGADDQAPYSITHLEIVSAALRAQALGLSVEPFFYLRDPTALPAPESLEATPAELQAYAATYFQAAPAAGQPDLRERLVQLKTQIAEMFGPQGRVHVYPARWDPHERNPATPAVPGQLAGLERLGELVEANIHRAIEACFARHLVALHEPRDAVRKEQDRQEVFISARVQVHVPDAELQAHIDAYVGGESRRACCVSGPSGSGKSAALCYWMVTRGSAGAREWAGETDSVVLFRAVGASPESARLHDLVGSLWTELRTRLAGQPQAEALPEATRDPGARLREWPAFLAAASALSESRIAIVIDGVDQLEGGVGLGIASWIPTRLPEKVRMLLSTASDATAGADWLAAMRLRGVDEVHVPLLDDTRSRAIVRELPSLYAKSLDASQTAILLDNPASRNPLYLTVALRELKLFGAFDRLDDAIASLPRLVPGEAPDNALHKLFDTLLMRLQDDQPQLTKPLVASVLAWLAASRRGLAESDLVALLVRFHDEVEPRAREGVLQIVLRQLRPYLQRRGSSTSVLIGFFHRSMLEAVALRFLPDDHTRAERREQLAEHFAAQPWFDDEGNANEGKVLELPWLRLRIARVESEVRALEALLMDWHLLDAKYRAGYVYELASDLRDGQLLLPGNKLLALVEEALRRDLGFIEAHRTDYPQALLQCLWNTCWWYDHPDARAHYEPGAEAARFDGQLAAWVDDCRRQAAERLPGLPWLRQLRPPFIRLGSGLCLRVTGFTHAVTQVVWSHDGRFLLAASVDPALRVINAKTGEEIYRIASVGRQVQSLAVSPDGQRIALGLRGSVTLETIREFALLSGEPLATYKLHRSAVHKLRYSRDGARLYAASGDGTVSMWSTTTGEMLLRIGTPVAESHATRNSANFDFVGDAGLLLVCSCDPAVRLWDTRQSREIDTIRTGATAVTNVQVSPDGTMFAFHSGYDSDRGLWIYGLDGTVVAHLDRENSHGGPVAWTPDSRRVAVCNSVTRLVRIYEVVSGQCVAEIRSHLSEVNSLAFSPDGRRLASASGNTLASIGLSTENEFEVHVMRPDTPVAELRLRDHTNEVSTLRYTPDGSQLLSLAKLRTLDYKQEAQPVRLWDTAEMRMVGARHVGESIETFKIGPGGDLAVTTGRYHDFDEQEATAVRVWRWPQMQSLAVKRIPFGGYARIAPDARTLWVHSRSKAGAVGQWQFALPDLMRSRELDVFATAFSPDGSLVVSVTHNDGKSSRIEVRETIGLTKVAQIDSHEGHIDHVLFTPSADRLIFIDGYAIVVRAWPSNGELHRLRGHSWGIEALRVSDDGRWLTSVDNRRTCIWDLASGECVRAEAGGVDLGLPPHAPFAARLWPCSTEGELYVFRGDTGAPLAYIPGAWHCLCTHPSENHWAAATQWHVQAWTLERLDAHWQPPLAADFTELATENQPLAPMDPNAGVLRRLRHLLRRIKG